LVDTEKGYVKFPPEGKDLGLFIYGEGNVCKSTAAGIFGTFYAPFGIGKFVEATLECIKADENIKTFIFDDLIPDDPKI